VGFGDESARPCTWSALVEESEVLIRSSSDSSIHHRLCETPADIDDPLDEDIAVIPRTIVVLRELAQ
jgi:hypothetical protein